jgi:hypothetical protein
MARGQRRKFNPSKEALENDDELAQTACYVTAKTCWWMDRHPEINIKTMVNRGIQLYLRLLERADEAIAGEGNAEGTEEGRDETQAEIIV